MWYNHATQFKGGESMAELMLQELTNDLLDRLKARAVRHGRTPAEEAKTILAEVVASETAYDWSAVEAIRQRLAASGRSFVDSAELLREDRDR
jgi:antitoxin FitA